MENKQEEMQYCEIKGVVCMWWDGDRKGREECGGEDDRKGREGTSRLVYTSWHTQRVDVM
jgi:hypothetical protein